MFLVPYQMSLFDWRPLAEISAKVTDADRDKRSANQWTKSIIAYLEWRAGQAWRYLYPTQRLTLDHCDYLDAMSLVRGAARREIECEAEKQPPLPLLAAAPVIVIPPEILGMSHRELVDEMLRFDPTFRRASIQRYKRRKLQLIVMRFRDRAPKRQPVQNSHAVARKSAA